MGLRKRLIGEAGARSTRASLNRVLSSRRLAFLEGGQAKSMRFLYLKWMVEEKAERASTVDFAVRWWEGTIPKGVV